MPGDYAKSYIIRPRELVDLTPENKATKEHTACKLLPGAWMPTTHAGSEPQYRFRVYIKYKQILHNNIGYELTSLVVRVDIYWWYELTWVRADMGRVDMGTS